MILTDLTIGQREALEVLRDVRVKAVRGGKKASGLSPVPHVNTRATESLVDKGLARRFIVPYASVFTSGYEYQITPNGECRP